MAGLYTGALRQFVMWWIRPGTPADLAFLRIALYHAVFWRAGTHHPPIEGALADPHVGRYIRDWGRPGDTAVLAEAPEAGPIGAAWYRLFSRDEPGYGFVGLSLPEISLAVLPSHRGRGIGRALLAALLHEARTSGFGAVSLSVDRDNPAVILYERLGFRRVRAVGGSWTMCACLT